MKNYSFNVNTYLLAVNNIFDAIDEFPNIKVSYQLQQMKKEVNSIRAKFYENRNALIKKYGKKVEGDKSGENYTIEGAEPENLSKFQEETAKGLAEVIDISFNFDLLESILEEPDFKPTKKEGNNNNGRAYHDLLSFLDKGKSNFEDKNKNNVKKSK